MREPAAAALPGTRSRHDGTKRNHFCGIWLPWYCTGFLCTASNHHDTHQPDSFVLEVATNLLDGTTAVFGDHDSESNVLLFRMESESPRFRSAVVVRSASTTPNTIIHLQSSTPINIPQRFTAVFFRERRFSCVSDGKLSAPPITHWSKTPTTPNNTLSA